LSEITTQQVRLIKPRPRLGYEEALPRRKLNSALWPRSLLSLLAMFLAAFQLPTSRMDEGTLLVYPRAGFEETLPYRNS